MLLALSRTNIWRSLVLPYLVEFNHSLPYLIEFNHSLPYLVEFNKVLPHSSSVTCRYPLNFIFLDNDYLRFPCVHLEFFAMFYKFYVIKTYQSKIVKKKKIHRFFLLLFLCASAVVHTITKGEIGFRLIKYDFNSSILRTCQIVIRWYLIYKEIMECVVFLCHTSKELGVIEQINHFNGKNR